MTRSSSANVVVAVTAIALAAGCKFPYPADVRDDDASVGSDDAGPVDGPVDARPDAPTDAPIDAPRIPLVVNNQAADLVVGQPNFTADTFSTRTPQSIFFPNAVAATASAVWTVELQGRALRYSPLPQGSQAAASLVVGALAFNANPPPATVNGREIDFSNACGLAVAGSKVLVTDATRNRILVWGFPPTTNGEAASFALGQASVSSSTAGSGRNQLRTPGGVWTDGTKLMVADTGNHRVLIWYNFPASNADLPDVVLGQTDFGLGTPPALPSAARMRSPACVFSDGQRVFVSDTGHQRVLVWSMLPVANGAAADLVVGQADFVSNVEGAGPNRLSGPMGLAIADGALLVADSGNDRVLVYDPTPTANGASATHSLGQLAPDMINQFPSVTASSLNAPTGLAVTGSYLYVGDSVRHRLLRFRLGRP